MINKFKKIVCVLVFAAGLGGGGFQPMWAQEKPGSGEIGTAKAVSVISVEEFADSVGDLWGAPVSKLLSVWQARWELAEAAASGGRTVAAAYWSGRKIFGVGAEQVKIESEKGVPVRVEIMFFNKGDSTSRAGMGYGSEARASQKEEFSEGAWRDCLSRVMVALESLGEKRKCSIGAGKLRRRAEAWKRGETVFVLDAQKNEFVRVFVVPVSRFGELTSSVAERVKSGGKLSLNLEKRENGDVLISNIPMVNQGQKGYCVPATVERVLRYYGIDDLDMHKIAELAGTGVGGGTSLSATVRGLAPVVKKNKLAFSSQKLSLSKVRQSVDRGVPLIWAMYSTPEYEDRMTGQTSERTAAVGAPAWAKRLSAMEDLEFSPEEARKSAHVCLIIGYNMKTKELCVSNSWGDFAKEHWVRFRDAELVSQSNQIWLLK
ncbi:MAG: C39 family peptidase [Opitutales bacterium]|nr:C39 family peptidase [Opitutales bacterium]